MSRGNNAPWAPLSWWIRALYKSAYYYYYYYLCSTWILSINVVDHMPHFSLNRFLSLSITFQEFHFRNTCLWVDYEAELIARRRIVTRLFRLPLRLRVSARLVRRRSVDAPCTEGWHTETSWQKTKTRITTIWFQASSELKCQLHFYDFKWENKSITYINYWLENPKQHFRYSLYPSSSTHHCSFPSWLVSFPKGKPILYIDFVPFSTNSLQLHSPQNVFTEKKVVRYGDIDLERCTLTLAITRYW